MWCSPDSQSWDTCSAGEPVVGLQLEDLSESDIISSNEASKATACLADPELQMLRWDCQSSLPEAFSDAQQPACQPWLFPLRSADEVGLQLQCAGPFLNTAHAFIYARAAGPFRCRVACGRCGGSALQEWL